MILEIKTEIKGDLVIESPIAFKKHPYDIKVYNENEIFYISISKRISDFKEFLPKTEFEGAKIERIVFPKQDFFNDITELLQHIESFGSIDIGINKILWDEPEIIWKPENDSEHLSLVKSYKRRIEPKKKKYKITENWLSGAVLHKRQFGELYIPFSFYREGVNLFDETRYQSAFCSFFMLLEYFFNEGKWGINNDAYKREICLNTCLGQVLSKLPDYENHHQWLIEVLKSKSKNYDEEGLLFILNRYRDALSHASNKSANRNLFNDKDYFSLAFIANILSRFVSIKQRLLPFVREQEKDSFLRKY